jgi:hypothetical protein
VTGTESYSAGADTTDLQVEHVASLTVAKVPPASAGQRRGIDREAMTVVQVFGATWRAAVPTIAPAPENRKVRSSAAPARRGYTWARIALTLRIQLPKNERVRRSALMKQFRFARN